MTQPVTLDDLLEPGVCDRKALNNGSFAISGCIEDKLKGDLEGVKREFKQLKERIAELWFLTPAQQLQWANRIETLGQAIESLSAKIGAAALKQVMDEMGRMILEEMHARVAFGKFIFLRQKVVHNHRKDWGREPENLMLHGATGSDVTSLEARYRQLAADVRSAGGEPSCVVGFWSRSADLRQDVTRLLHSTGAEKR